MTIEEFEKLMTFYTTSKIFSEETKQILIENLYKQVNRKWTQNLYIM